MGEVAKKYQLGSFSNDGLSIGLSNSELSDEDMIKIRNLVSIDMSNIEIDLTEQLYRMENFLKKEIGVIPRSEDFVKWFYDKRKINQTGKSLPRISDDELIDFTKVYLSELKRKTTKRQNINDEIWLLDVSLLQRLTDFLFQNKCIDNNQDFYNVFNDANKRVNWLADVTLLIYLLDEKLKTFTRIPLINRFIENSFYHKNKHITNLKNIKYNLYNNKNSKPRNYQLIDNFFIENQKDFTLPNRMVK